MCSTSSANSAWHQTFMAASGDSGGEAEQQSSTKEHLASLISIQQSALMSTLGLKNVSNCTIMKLLSTFFQYSSMKLFEPLNVYEKCKLFMCSMRCSESPKELLCMIDSLNEILSNETTAKELRVVLLKEHLSYLLKLTSSTYTPPPPPAGEVNSSSTVVPSPPDTPSNLTANNVFSIYADDGLQLIKSLLDLLESMVNLMSDESKEETLTVFIHILSFYLNLNVDGPDVNAELRKRLLELNDLVLKKLVRLGKNHTQSFKLILNKWPSLKLKIETAIKASVSGVAMATNAQPAPGTPTSANTTTSAQGTPAAVQTPTSVQSASSSSSSSSAAPTPGGAKAPKIQLKNFGAFK